MKTLTYDQKCTSPELKAFLDAHKWTCPDCGGSGEYETGCGPRGCGPCNSRLCYFLDHEGKAQWLDWGDSVVIDGDVFTVVRAEQPA